MSQKIHSPTQLKPCTMGRFGEISTNIRRLSCILIGCIFYTAWYKELYSVTSTIFIHCPVCVYSPLGGPCPALRGHHLILACDAIWMLRREKNTSVILNSSPRRANVRALGTNVINYCLNKKKILHPERLSDGSTVHFIAGEKSDFFSQLLYLR